MLHEQLVPRSMSMSMSMSMSVSLRGVSAVGACAMATGGRTWAQAKSEDLDSGVLEEVVVAARRAAIEFARMRKKKAEVVVDSAVADDAGKLPDNSITEVPRPVSGVAGWLSGREIFSANGDVTPKPMAAVDLYKSAPADQIDPRTDRHVNASPRLSF